MPKLNIVYFAPCSVDEGIGGSARLKNMVDVLHKLGANVRLISYLQGNSFKVRTKQLSSYLTAVVVYVPKSFPKVLKLLALPLLFLCGLKYIKKGDIIFAHSPSIATGFPALLLAKIFNKPLIVDHIDMKDHNTPKFIYNSVLKNASIVFVISHYLEEEANAKGCSDVIYLPAFIDTDAFQKVIPERDKIRRKLGINDNEFVIGYAGSFSPIQGLPVLVNAFKNLSSRCQAGKLVIIGGVIRPKSDDNVATLINELNLGDKAILIPPQPYKSIPGYLSAFDIACSPKIDCQINRAANPIKIYEYMSMGLPTVISTVDETSNLIENGVDGFLVRPGDESDLESILEYLIMNREKLKKIGEKARQKVLNSHSISSAEAKFRQALTSRKLLLK